jgi:hypothetical protein
MYLTIKTFRCPVCGDNPLNKKDKGAKIIKDIKTGNSYYHCNAKHTGKCGVISLNKLHTRTTDDVVKQILNKVKE